MGYIKIWVHIKENAERKGIYIDFINGYLEHVHCLVSLGSGQTIDKIVMLLKGESSYWINKNKICSTKFAWQEEYFAVSVSESMINRVREYIKNQENHHKKRSFDADYNEFIRKYGFDAFIAG